MMRPLLTVSAEGFFARISRVRRRTKQALCLHISMIRKSYGEQRERRTQGVLSLLIAVCLLHRLV